MSALNTSEDEYLDDGCGLDVDNCTVEQQQGGGSIQPQSIEFSFHSVLHNYVPVSLYLNYKMFSSSQWRA